MARRASKDGWHKWKSRKKKNAPPWQFEKENKILGFKEEAKMETKMETIVYRIEVRKKYEFFSVDPLINIIIDNNKLINAFLN